MSELIERSSVHDKSSEEPGCTNFLFINVEENIKQEKIDDEQLVKEDDNEIMNGCETLKEDFKHNILKEDRLKGSLPNGAGNQQQIGCEGDHTSEVSRECSKATDLNIGNNNKVFSCDKCSISFISSTFLEGHKNRCRAIVRNDENCHTDEKTADTETTLDMCNTSTQEPHRVKRRVPKGMLKHKCTICGRRFVLLRFLKAHEPMHARFKCSECPYVSDLHKNLKRHMMMHARKEEKIYACPHCSYTAVKSSYLRKHVAKHAEEKPFTCHLCPYGTAVSENLTKHMLTHESQKPFACCHCYYSTTKKAQLAKHLEKFHSVQGKTGT